MALVKRRPKLQVLVHERAHPGEPLDVTFELDVTRPLQIEHFDVSLRGSTRVAVSDKVVSEVGVPIALGARLSGPRDLPVGTQRFPCRFTLPDWAPPTFSGRVVRVAYRIAVEVAIPWWPDLDREFELVVSQRSVVGDREPRPLLFSTAPEGPRGGEPHAEVSLASGEVRAGEVLSGAVALINVAGARYSGIVVRLTGHERAVPTGRAAELGRWQIDVPLEAPQEGEPILFDFLVPDVPPSFASDVFRVWWSLDVTVTRRFGSDLLVSIPVTVLPSTRRARARARHAPPTVGNARVQRVWQDVAQRIGMLYEDGRLNARISEVDVSVQRDHVDGRPTLAAEIRFPSLGLELSGHPVGGLSRLWGSDGVPLGRRTRLSGRDAGQIRAVAAFLDPCLGACAVRLVDDERILLERPGAGLTAEPVNQIAEIALVVARRIPELTRTLPPPQGVELKAWRELADRLGGDIFPARPSVVGELDGRRVEVSQAWAPGGVPSAQRVCVHALAPIVARHGEALPSDARALVDAWAARGWQTVIESDRVTLVLPGGLSDPGAIVAVVHDVAAWVDLLGGRGAYR
ncbi:MAG: hypothetical protein IT377_05330 [Polyangiaceae bacterium]|nr:hypothetical protein [Polyangiaceae bacterium]